MVAREAGTMKGTALSVPQGPQGTCPSMLARDTEATAKTLNPNLMWGSILLTGTPKVAELSFFSAIISLYSPGWP